MNSDDSAFDRFPGAALYRDALPAAFRSRERPPDYQEPFTERHLHCVWYDERLRPENLKTEQGETVRVHHPGQWNLEAGPDFLHATLEVGGRLISGDVEVHIRPMDWQQHGHREDPRYQNVRFHLTYHPGSLPPGLLPPGCVEISLKTSLDARSHFFFDSIDTGAYPWNVPSSRNHLQTLLADRSEEERGDLLDAAGLERLRRKTLRMLRVIETVGPGQALYQALMRALGYKHNSEAIECLARALPVHELRARSADDPWTAFSLLSGVGGLLEHVPAHDERLRALWDVWWKQRNELADRALSSSAWTLHASRPANHPLRRLEAAGTLFLRQPTLEEVLPVMSLENAGRWKRTVMRLLDAPPADGPRSDAEPHLLGEGRRATIVVNAVVPFLAALRHEPLPLSLLRALPPEAPNERTRRTAHFLFGPDYHPRIVRSTLRKQGLLQFYEDFGA